MNIIRPGDHIFIAMPIAFERGEHSEAFREALKVISDLSSVEGLVPMGHFSMSWLPVGPVGSMPEVLFVYRDETAAGTKTD